MVDLVFRKRTGFWVRPGTSDDLVIDECLDYKHLFTCIKDNDVFIDIGANIGVVSSLCNSLNKNTSIISYEPDPENFNILKKNCNDFGLLINSAIGKEKGITKLYHSEGSNKGKHSTKNRGFSKSITVKKESFLEQIKINKPTLIKCDIEGGEYELNFENLPNYIKGIAIEIHKIDNNWKNMKKLYNILQNQFPYKLGDIPVNNNWYKERDCFMTIFLRNEE